MNHLDLYIKYECNNTLQMNIYVASEKYNFSFFFHYLN